MNEKAGKVEAEKLRNENAKMNFQEKSKLKDIHATLQTEDEVIWSHLMNALVLDATDVCGTIMTVCKNEQLGGMMQKQLVDKIQRMC